MTLFLTLYISYSCFTYIANGHLYLLISLTYFFPLAPSPCWQPPVHFLYLWLLLFFYVLLFFFFFFSELTYKWNHTIFVFLWDISFSLVSSRSILDNTNDNILFFFYGWVIFYYIYFLYIYHIFFIHSSIDEHLGCFLSWL